MSSSFPLPVEPVEQAARTRAEINRANALLSTGPRTEAGKAKSRYNNLRHGLCAQTVILSPEDRERLEDFQVSLAASLDAAGDLELTLIQNVAESQFQIERARAIENNILQLGALNHTDRDDPNRDFETDLAIGLAETFKVEAKTIDLLSRYGARHSRVLLQNHQRLLKAQKERRALEKQGHRHRPDHPATRQPNQQVPKDQSPISVSGFVRQPVTTIEEQARAERSEREKRACEAARAAMEARKNRKNQAA